MPEELIQMLRAFFLFIRSRKEVVHLMFVPGYSGVSIPTKEEIESAAAYVDVEPDQPDTSIDVSDWGIKFKISQPSDSMVQLPWESVLIVANDLGLSWTNKPLMMAMGEAALLAARSRDHKPEFVH